MTILVIVDNDCNGDLNFSFMNGVDMFAIKR